MTRPTPRGMALLAIAALTYLAARILGTWELYLMAFAFVTVVAVAWVLVLASGRQLRVARSVTPAQPIAGDALTLSLRVTNGSLLPGLQVTLLNVAGALGGRDRSVEVDSLWSRAERAATAGPWPAQRGVYHLPALVALAEDPLGLVCSRREVGDTLDLTVPPQIVHLTSCVLLADVGARRGDGPLRRPTLEVAEYRGARPHTPGEPLNRVDWKATAKTGTLMLRESESAGASGVTLLLNGAAAHLVGEPPATNFELAAQAAGSLADFALRAGHPATLLLPENDWRPLRLSPDAHSHRRLLEALAGARPGGLTQLGPSLRALVSAGGPRSRPRTLTLVVLAFDRALARAAITLREEGIRVAVVHIEASSFVATVPSAESLGLRLSLAAAGVHYVSLGHGDDLRTALSSRLAGTRAGAR